MMAHNRSLERGKSGGSALMEKSDPLEQPGKESGGEMAEHHPTIHDHLRQMHEVTGEAHSHVEHHSDGSHTSHHVDMAGEISGPHHHANSDEMAEHMKSMGHEEPDGDEMKDEPEYE